MSGCHQIKLSAELTKYTSFVTPDGKYDYLKVSFGLSNEPFLFQRTVYNILGDLRFLKVLVHLNNVLIPSQLSCVSKT